MLSTLRIRNLALVPDLVLDLHPGLNVITGETGAGKSVILGAIQLAIGQRADRSAIRAGADLLSVEAVFMSHGLQDSMDGFLADAGIDPCEGGMLVVRRSVSSSGVNRQFINGSPTTLATLSTIGEWLVDLHGPHDHQSLLQPAKQLAILDAFGGLRPVREAFAHAVRRRDTLRHELAALVADPSEAERQRDLLRHQVREIEAARLQPGEEESLVLEHSRSANAARLLELSRAVESALSGDDDSLSQRMAVLARTLHDMARLDPSIAGATALHQQASGLLLDLQDLVERHARSINLDPERLAALSERLNLVQSLRRKYGNTVEDILAFAEIARAQLAALEHRDETASALHADIEAAMRDIADLGARLRAERQSVAPRLASAANHELAALGFRQSDLLVSLLPAAGHDHPSTAGPTGLDDCDFLFSPNPGEPRKPLRAIASSGELARVMLALKTVLAAQDTVPVLVFDEVDANVGGETAHAVGQKLRQIAANHQVLCISHLAPVAAHAHAHYSVTKVVHEGRTESRIQLLDDDGRAVELGRMLGGGQAATRHAKDLLADARTRSTTA